MAPIVCNLSLADIIAQLHEKALEAAKAKYSNFELVNSAIEGKKGSYMLVGAGQHIITAVVKEGTVTKAEAKPALQTYVSWFVGPDLKGDLKDDSIYELQTEEPTAKPDEKASDKKDENASQKKESISVISFSKYLNESSALTLEDNSDNVDDVADADGIAADAEANADDGSQDDDSSEAKNGDDSKEDASEDNQPKDDLDPKSRGWYIAYELDIEGAKRRSTFVDSIKFMAHGAKNLLKNLVAPISITFGSFSGTRTTKTLGDLAKGLGDLKDGFAAVFGKIDSTKLKTEFDKKLKQKLPKTNTTTEYFDKATIGKHLNKALTSADKAKVNAAEYSLCVKVPHNDLSQKAIKKAEIADLVTSSIQGMFKKFKNKVNPDDIILVNNVNDNGTASDKVSVKKESSHVSAWSQTLLTEDSKKADDSTLQSLREKLKTLAESKLSGSLQQTAVDTAQNIMSMLEKADIKDDSLKSSLSEADYAFLIETEEDISENAQQNVNSSNRTHVQPLQSLFETALFKTTNIDAIRSVFESLIAEFGDSLGKDVAIKKTALHDLKAYVSEEAAAKNESMLQSLQHAMLMFEALFPEDDVILEKSKNKKKKFYKDQAKSQQKASSQTTDSADNADDNDTQDNSKQPKKQHVFYAIPDENNLAFMAASDDKDDKGGNSSSGKQTFVFGYKDPKDPKKFVVVGKPSIVDDVDELSYRDLPVVDNDKALKWDPSEEELLSNPSKYIGNPDYTRKDEKGNVQTKIIAVFGNVVAQDNGTNDFYIIPMKGLKMSGE